MVTGEERPDNQKPKRSAALLVVWICSTVLGFPVAFNSLSHIRADGGHWDAVVPLTLAQATDWAEARLRTFRGGHFRVWLSTVGFDETNKGQFFTGRVDIVVHDPSGVEKFVGSVGDKGVNLAKTVNSGWAQVGDLDIPAAWFRPWILRARVAAGDDNFNGMTAQVILRKVRPELGMGGMVFYVLVFPAVALAILSLFLSIILLTRGYRWPAAATFVVSLPLLFLAVFTSR
jgi:hypothetical protein